jgi:N-acetylmuramoyl-L-alanine amidase
MPRYAPLLLAAVLLAACQHLPGAAPSPSAPVVVIDPGHPSEVAAGNVVLNGTTEAHVDWVVAERLAPLLRGMGYRVRMTKSREDEMVTNVDRARFANAAGAALMVRLHCDASSDSGYALYAPDRQGTAQGVTGPSPEVIRRSTAAAEALHAGMAPLLAGRLRDGGVRGDSRTLIGSRQGALTGSIFSEVPTVTIEMATLTTPSDAAFMRSDEGVETVARAIAAGVARAVPRAGKR